MLIKEYVGYFNEVENPDDKKKDGKNDKKKDGEKRVRNRRKKVQKQDSV